MVAGRDERVMSATGDRVYVRGIPESGGQHWDVVRREQTFTDPESGEVLGVLARRLGSAQLDEHGDPATLMLTSSNREILSRDLVLPASDEALDSRMMPRAPEQEIDGVIMTVLDGVNQIGQYDVVTINRGEAQGLASGHVLSVYEEERVVSDPKTDEPVALPAEHEGTLLVFRTFERMSLGLIMEATRAISVGDAVRNP
ncbi:MAG: hypothetical protein U5L11_10260 [Arhodomonas sp.]|nr:hypothetical protein [Arhodomonas sp.]